MSEQRTKTQSTDSIFGLIAFGGTEIPIGFLTSFAKPSHTNCLGRGLTVQRVGDKVVRHICSCTVNRAAKRLRQIGTDGFKKLGEEWALKMQDNPKDLPPETLPAEPSVEPPKEST